MDAARNTCEVSHAKYPWGLVILVFLSGCGGHTTTHSARSEVKAARPALPIWCPTRRIAPAQSEPNARAARSFDTRTLLGEPEARAAAAARREGCSWRVVARDGRSLVVTADAVTDRVDATVNQGIVTAVGVY